MTSETRTANSRRFNENLNSRSLGSTPVTTASNSRILGEMRSSAIPPPLRPSHTHTHAQFLETNLRGASGALKIRASTLASTLAVALALIDSVFGSDGVC